MIDDLRDQDREPDEPEPEPPLTLEEIQAVLDECYAGGASVEGMEASAVLADRAVPQLLAELADARERLARWEALPVREEWTVTVDAASPPKYGPRHTADEALTAAAHEGTQAWRRVVADGPIIVRNWEPISTEPPF